MADTLFVNGTVVLPAWLNDINDHVYKNKSFVSNGFAYLRDPTYGAVGDGVEDDTAAIQAAIDAMALVGGGYVLGHGYTYKTTSTIVNKENVVLDLQGGKLEAHLSGLTDVGYTPLSGAAIMNGEIAVISTGTVATQAGAHAPITVGPLYGSGGTVASPSEREGVTGWLIDNMKLSTDRDGKVALQVVGGANNGIIRRITVPDSSVMAGGVHLDWGYVGTISSGDIATSRANFDAGTAYTTHPHNIIIEQVKIGSLTRTKTGVDTGSHGVRISGCHNIYVSGIAAKQTTYAFIRVTAGDLGYEFAPAALKPFALKGIVVQQGVCENTTNSWGVYADSFADNIDGAVTSISYSPRLDPVHTTDLHIHHITAKGSGASGVTAGLDIRQIRGAQFTNISMRGYQYGCLLDEKVYNVQIHGSFIENRGHGIYIHHGTYPPEDVHIMPGTECYSNGQDSGFLNPAGIFIDGALRTVVDKAYLGHRTSASETTQLHGLRVNSTSSVDTVVKNCHVFSVKSSGVGYSLIASTSYNILKLFHNNTVASSVSTKMSGLDIIPINRFLAPSGVEITHNIASRTVLTADITPTAGTWPTGTVIFYSNPPTGKTGTRCETAGSPGTWAQF